MGDAQSSGWKTALIAVIGGVVGAAVANGLGAALGPTFVVKVMGGAAAGGICGLIPYFASRRKDRAFARKSVWICVGSGMILGVILALPVAVVTAIIGSRRTPQPAE